MNTTMQASETVHGTDPETGQSQNQLVKDEDLDEKWDPVEYSLVPETSLIMGSGTQIDRGIGPKHFPFMICT